MERSLVLIKPDAVRNGQSDEIISRLKKLGFKMAARKALRMDRALAEKHYAVHKEKPFFKELVEYMTSAPIVAAVFEGEKVVAKIRQAMGTTDPAKAEAGTIRADFGLNVTRNAVHGSDSVATAEKEIRLFFTEDEIAAT
ncbi:MAG: nucleoside-diphosphate kinase [Dehalococcoidia bacterium]|nr:nucleoside-diphosphate kinase [Dehalococcoidia bacterium]